MYRATILTPSDSIWYFDAEHSPQIRQSITVATKSGIYAYSRLFGNLFKAHAGLNSQLENEPLVGRKPLDRLLRLEQQLGGYGQLLGIQGLIGPALSGSLHVLAVGKRRALLPSKEVHGGIAGHPVDPGRKLS